MLIAEGDEQAFTRLFKIYGNQLYPTMLRITKSAGVAEELIQEVMLRIWVSRDKLPGIENPRAWIFRIATNLAITWLRKQLTEEKSLRQVRYPHVVDKEIIENQISLKELQKEVKKAVDNLSPQRKLVYELSRNNGLNKEEIAEQLHISVNTVKTTLVKALQSIRHDLNQSGYHLAIIYLILLQK